MYTIKEIFSTLQGEGSHSGRVAVFCRFTGCNLWSGREEDRATAQCRFCDTDFVGTDGLLGGKYSTAFELADTIEKEWLSMNPSESHRYVVFTGGEPLLQLDQELIWALHQRSFEIGVETNGTIKPPNGIDWLCVSPKDGTELICLVADEIKYIVPQLNGEIDKKSIVQRLKRFENMNFKNFFIQPMDGPNRDRHLQFAISLCKERPKWRLSIQQHKYINLP
jgi:7-carboxy-7-deazaguanine synthase (Cx14CxxC type)